MNLGELVTTLTDSLQKDETLEMLLSYLYTHNRFLSLWSKKVAESKVVEKLGRGLHHPLAPRLRKLAAAAIGVRGDWGK